MLQTGAVIKIKLKFKWRKKRERASHIQARTRSRADIPTRLRTHPAYLMRNGPRLQRFVNTAPGIDRLT